MATEPDLALSSSYNLHLIIHERQIHVYACRNALGKCSRHSYSLGKVSGAKRLRCLGVPCKIQKEFIVDPRYAKGLMFRT